MVLFPKCHSQHLGNTVRIAYTDNSSKIVTTSFLGWIEYPPCDKFSQIKSKLNLNAYNALVITVIFQGKDDALQVSASKRKGTSDKKKRVFDDAG